MNLSALSNIYYSPDYVGEALVQPLKAYNRWVFSTNIRFLSLEKIILVALTFWIAYPVFGTLALVGLSIKAIHYCISLVSKTSKNKKTASKAVLPSSQKIALFPEKDSPDSMIFSTLTRAERAVHRWRYASDIQKAVGRLVGERSDENYLVGPDSFSHSFSSHVSSSIIHTWGNCFVIPYQSKDGKTLKTMVQNLGQLFSYYHLQIAVGELGSSSCIVFFTYFPLNPSELKEITFRYGLSVIYAQKDSGREFNAGKLLAEMEENIISGLQARAAFLNSKERLEKPPSDSQYPRIQAVNEAKEAVLVQVN